MAGGGIDVNLSRHIALRLLRADYVFSNHRFGPAATVPETDVRGARLQSGVVFMFGGKSVGPAVSVSCTLNPDQVMAGEPVTAMATGNNFNSTHSLAYMWSSTGGKITGNDATASIDTNGAAAGNYAVSVRVSDSKMKRSGEAMCSVNFTVKAPPPQNPPTMSCQASPSTIQAGSASTISCTCASPDNSPVTVSGWTASGGSVSGSGSTAALDSSGDFSRPDYRPRQLWRFPRLEHASRSSGHGCRSASPFAGNRATRNQARTAQHLFCNRETYNGQARRRAAR